MAFDTRDSPPYLGWVTLCPDLSSRRSGVALSYGVRRGAPIEISGDPLEAPRPDLPDRSCPSPGWTILPFLEGPCSMGNL